MGCPGARLGAFFWALTAAIGGTVKAEGALPGTLATDGGAIGGTRGAGLGACTIGGKGPLAIGGTIGGAGGGAMGVGRGAGSLAAGTAGIVDNNGTDTGDAL